MRLYPKPIKEVESEFLHMNKKQQKSFLWQNLIRCAKRRDIEDAYFILREIRILEGQIVNDIEY